MDFNVATLRQLCIDNNIPLKGRVLKSTLLQILTEKKILNTEQFTDVETKPKKRSSDGKIKRNSKKKDLTPLISKIKQNLDPVSDLVCFQKENGNLQVNNFILNMDGYAIGKTDGDKLDEHDVDTLNALGIPFDIDKVNLHLTQEKICEKCAGILTDCSFCRKTDFLIANDFVFDEEDDDDDEF